MRINFAAPLSTIYGIPMVNAIPDPADPEKEVEITLTLGHVSVEALLRNEKDADGKTKLNRYLLAKRVHECEGTLELKVKEVAVIQKQIGKSYGPIIVGQALPMLEGMKDEAPEPTDKAAPELIDKPDASETTKATAGL